MDEGATAESATRPGGAEEGWALPWTLVVLTGGASRRMGRDKASARLADRTLLDHVLGGVPADIPVVIVGADLGTMATPRRQAPLVCREDPPGSGPAAAVAAALPLVTTSLLGLLATDMPFAAGLLADLIRKLAGRPDLDAVAPVDASGRRQPLAAAYRTEPLRAAAAARDLAGSPLRTLLADLVSAEVQLPDAHRWQLRDLDTPADLAWAERRYAAQWLPTDTPAAAAGILDSDDERTTMDTTATWIANAAQALGIDADIDTPTVLDVARDVAHGVERPAAPLTTYLLGVAVGRGADPVEAAATIRGLLDDADA